MYNIYRYNGLHLPMTTMDAASLHHSMGYSADPYLSGGNRRMNDILMIMMMMIMTMIMPRSA